jgi:hypothetical protein
MIRYKNIRYYTDIDEFNVDWYSTLESAQVNDLKNNGFLIIIDSGRKYNKEVWCSGPVDECNIGIDKDCQTCKELRSIYLRKKKLERICNDKI